MAIPINPLSDKSVAYRSVVDFYSARSSFAIPRKVILCLTDRCNMRCNMCTLQHTTVEKKELEVSDWVEAIEELSWAKPTFLLFGGEPCCMRMLVLFWIFFVNGIVRWRS